MLHPLYAATSLHWTAAGIDVRQFALDNTGTPEYLRSPIHHARANRLSIIRRRLSGRTALRDFPVLDDIQAMGGHDYLLLLVGFNESGTSGIVCSWVADRPSGFTDGEINTLQRLTNRLAVALKGRLERSIARNLAGAYLGAAAGEQVLSGAIHRGDGQKIQAALWYSDLRQSSTLADRHSTEAFLQILNRYFEMTAGAIHDHGGEVVSFIGDAVLGFFRDDVDASDACARALAAAQSALLRRDTFMPQGDEEPFDFGIGLHLGQVIYGNVGIPNRLQFTLVGAAVNEVARVEDLTKHLGVSIVASAQFAHTIAGTWRSLGEHSLRGIEKPTEVFALGKPPPG